MDGNNFLVFERSLLWDLGLDLEYCWKEFINAL